MSGPFDHVEDHGSEIPELLLTQFRGKPRIEDITKALTSGAQGVEDAIHEVATERALSSAVGAQLDGIGEIVGRGRAGLSDDAYRAVLRAQVRVLLSSGTPEELLTIARLIMGADAPGPVTWRELYPAAGVMDLDEVPPVPPEIMVEMLQGARAGGVRLQMVFPPNEETEAEPFTFASDDAEEEAPTEGWADVWGPAVFDDAALYLAAFTAAEDGSEWPTLQGREATATQTDAGDRPDLVVHDPRFGLMPSIDAPDGAWMQVPHHADMSITASGLYIAALVASDSDESGNKYVVSKWDGKEWQLYLTTGAPRLVVRNSSDDGSALVTWGEGIRDGKPHVVEAYHDGSSTLGLAVDGEADVTEDGSFRSDTGDVFLFAESASKASELASSGILILPRMPSSAEREEIRDHMRSMAGMSGGTYPGGRLRDVIE